jgi:hypothetical protein
VLEALGVEPDAPFRALNETFRGPLAVGRPIDVREPVRMAEPQAAAR